MQSFEPQVHLLAYPDASLTLAGVNSMKMTERRRSDKESFPLIFYTKDFTKTVTRPSTLFRELTAVIRHFKHHTLAQN